MIWETHIGQFWMFLRPASGLVCVQYSSEISKYRDEILFGLLHTINEVRQMRTQQGQQYRILKVEKLTLQNVLAFAGLLLYYWFWVATCILSW
jgi:hypothetical protein